MIAVLALAMVLVPTVAGGAAARAAEPSSAELAATAQRIQKELADLAGDVRRAGASYDTALEQARAAQQRRAASTKQLRTARQKLDGYAESLFTGAGGEGDLRLLLTSPDPSSFRQGSGMMDYLREEKRATLQQAIQRREQAVAAEKDAAAALQRASDRKDELTSTKRDLQARAVEVSDQLSAVVRAAEGDLTARQQDQQRRNERAAAAWKDYRARVRAAGVESLPSADQLNPPQGLPAPVGPLLDSSGNPQSGVATTADEKGPMLVLPSETAQAMSLAVTTLGLPVGSGAGDDGAPGQTEYSCGGLISSVFGRAGLDLSSSPAMQRQQLRSVPVRQARPGDVLFVGLPGSSTDQVGLVLDSATMLAADAPSGTIAAMDLPSRERVLKVGRPALGIRQVAEPPDHAGEATCGMRLAAADAERAQAADPAPRGAGSGGDGADGAWGGYDNGLIPAAAMCGVDSGSHRLRCDAAAAFRDLSRAYADTFGSGICITDSYRSYQLQVTTYAKKPQLAAVPGTSNHGWGVAVDLCGGVQSFGSAQYRWLDSHAAEYGWVNPDWARPGAGKEEPWHWEYVG